MKNSVLLLALCLASPAIAQNTKKPAPTSDEQLAAPLSDTRARAEQGDAGTQFKLGVMYMNGQGVPKDEAQPVAWFRKAVEQGHDSAKDALREMHEQGRDAAAHGCSAWLRRIGKGLDRRRRV